GTNGTNGLTILNGIEPPTSFDGDNGDFYIDTTANKIYGPKTLGEWYEGLSLVGPAGSPGAAGPSGPAGATGPAGANGANGSNGAKGDTGATGAKGDTGATGATGASGSNGAQGAKGDTGASAAEAAAAKAAADAAAAAANNPTEGGGGSADGVATRNTVRYSIKTWTKSIMLDLADKYAGQIAEVSVKMSTTKGGKARYVNVDTVALDDFGYAIIKTTLQIKSGAVIRVVIDGVTIKYITVK
ncbi:MAG: hypothetical protein WCJ89_08415, partial [Actinomycetes bacterium]